MVSGAVPVGRLHFSLVRELRPIAVLDSLLAACLPGTYGKNKGTNHLISVHQRRFLLVRFDVLLCAAYWDHVLVDPVRRLFRWCRLRQHFLPNSQGSEPRSERVLTLDRVDVRRAGHRVRRLHLHPAPQSDLRT